jgi:hypothetical protein
MVGLLYVLPQLAWSLLQFKLPLLQGRHFALVLDYLYAAAEMFCLSATRPALVSGPLPFPAGKPWQLVDELVMDVASPHTRKLLKEYKQQSQVCYVGGRAGGPLRVGSPGMLAAQHVVHARQLPAYFLTMPCTAALILPTFPVPCARFPAFHHCLCRRTAAS